MYVRLAVSRSITDPLSELQLWLDRPDALEGLTDRCQRAWHLVEERQRKGKAGDSDDDDDDDDDDGNDDDADDDEEKEEEKEEERGPPAKLRKKGASHAPDTGFLFKFF